MQSLASLTGLHLVRYNQTISLNDPISLLGLMNLSVN
jgi:hypothetical protein